MTTPQTTSIQLHTAYRHSGTIHSMEPLRVETPPEQWSYAVSFPLQPAMPPSEELQLPVKVSATVSVESGELGCLLVAKDWTTLLGGLPAAARPGRHTVELLIERAADGPQLVFRNATGGLRPCAFVVESVSISPNDGNSLNWSVGSPALVDDVEVFDELRRKWKTVPAGLSDRRGSGDILTLSDADLREFWIATHREATTGSGFPVRGWYQTLYRDVLHGKKVLEVGSGMGIDGIEFGRHGARLTFVDIVEDNLAVMKRLCGIFGVRDAEFVYLRGFASLDVLPNDYDIVLSSGSQINVPFEFAKRECAALMPHLKSGGRWIELAYPRERWLRDGSPPFRIWGNMTDGEGTPWMEWYDLERLLDRLAPARFAPVLAINFHHDDFNWFDLTKLD